MQWPEGALDHHFSQSGRWIFRLLSLAIALVLLADFFINMSSPRGPTSWLQNAIYGGLPRKLALMLLLLADVLVCLVIAFAWDLATRQGRFARTDVNPYRFAENEDNPARRR